MDIVTVSFGWGAGVRARVGPVSAGLISCRDVAGIRGGRIGRLVPKDEMGNWALHDSYTVDVTLSSLETFNPDAMTRERGKSFSAFGMPIVSFPSRANNQEVFPYYYFTQVEAIVALGPSIRVGVNPGEFVDFLLGWFRVDIFDDDRGERPLADDENDFLEMLYMSPES